MGIPIQVGLVEDENSVREAVAAHLESSGKIRVIMQACDGEQLIRQLEIATNLPEICVVDISMPNMNGLELMKETRRRWPRINCIVYSKHHYVKTIIKSIQYGARAFINKDEPFGALMDAITATYFYPGFHFSRYVDEALYELAEKGERAPELTHREEDYIGYMVSGMHVEEIALRLGISLKGIEKLNQRCFRKLGVNNRADLITTSLRLGIVQLK